MADGITVPQSVIDYTRTGVYGQLESKVQMIKDYDGTTDEAIDHFGLRAYIENDISVISAERAYCNMLSNILNEETFKGAFAHLAIINNPVDITGVKIDNTRVPDINDAKLKASKVKE